MITKLLDALATTPQAAEALAPVWDALPPERRGTFYRDPAPAAASPNLVLTATAADGAVLGRPHFALENGQLVLPWTLREVEPGLLWAGTPKTAQTSAPARSQAQGPIADPFDALRIVILVPRRAGDPGRDKTWAWVRNWWTTEFPTFELFEGHHNDGPFNRSAAVNLAARRADEGQAKPWDAALIIDADVLCDPDRVFAGVEQALALGALVLPYDLRKDLNQMMSDRVQKGYQGSWEPGVRHRYENMVSSVVILSRKLWDEVGGFDEYFRGWGFEDDAFFAACETFAGSPALRLPGELWHLWHPTAPEGKLGSETSKRNGARAARYQAALGNRVATRKIQASVSPVALVPVPTSVTGIPRIFHRTLPAKIDPQVEAWWAKLQDLHPGWEFKTWRDPLDPAQWPLTSPHWAKCTAGAQLADLVRLEALLKWGGIYLDSDCEPLRPMDSLLPLSAFAGWEDQRCAPNAVLGAVPDHPAIAECLRLMIARMEDGQGVWECGASVTTDVLAGRADVLLLPPGSFFPIHYKQKQLLKTFDPAQHPWAFVIHRWAGSWLPAK